MKFPVSFLNYPSLKLAIIFLISHILFVLPVQAELKDTPGFHGGRFDSEQEENIGAFIYRVPLKKAKKKNPLVVVTFLWGSQDTMEMRKQKLGAIAIECDKRGFYLAVPNHRGRSAFTEVGNLDITSMIDALAKELPIDRNIIFGLGIGTGTIGLMSLTSQQPDLFKAVAGYNGYYDGSPLRHNILSLKGSENWIKLTEKMNPPIEMRSLASVPMYFKLQDKQPQFSAERFEMAIPVFKALGGKIRFEKLPEDVGAIPGEKDVADFFKFFEDQIDSPAIMRNQFRTGTLKNLQWKWMGAERLFSYNKPAEVQLKVTTSTQQLDIYTTQVSGLWLDAVQNNILWDKILVDGQELKIPSTKLRKVHLTRSYQKAKWKIDKEGPMPSTKEKPLKILTLEGPARDIFYKDFLLVYGATGKGKRETEYSQTAAEQISNYAKSHLGITLQTIPDNLITPKIAETSNLLLVGTPESNYLIRRVMRNSAIRLTKNSVKGIEDSYHGKKFLLDFIQVNPLNPEKYIRVIAAQDPRVLRYAFARIDLLAKYDYAIFDGKSRYPSLALEYGRFGARWNADQRSSAQRSFKDSEYVKSWMVPLWENLALVDKESNLDRLVPAEIQVESGMLWFTYDPAGNPFKLGGRAKIPSYYYKNGICPSPVSKLTWELDGKAEALRGFCGIHSELVVPGSEWHNSAKFWYNRIEFIIYVDGKQVWNSDRLAMGDQPKPFDIDLTSAKKVTLHTRTPRLKCWEVGLPVWADVKIIKAD